MSSNKYFKCTGNACLLQNDSFHYECRLSKMRMIWDRWHQIDWMYTRRWFRKYKRRRQTKRMKRKRRMRIASNQKVSKRKELTIILYFLCLRFILCHALCLIPDSNVFMSLLCGIKYWVCCVVSLSVRSLLLFFCAVLFLLLWAVRLISATPIIFRQLYWIANDNCTLTSNQTQKPTEWKNMAFEWQYSAFGYTNIGLHTIDTLEL